jgi:hypothetical protein
MRKILCVLLVFAATTIFAADVTVWMGNPDGSPLVWRIDSTEKVPVWVKTGADVYAAAVHIPLATDDRFVVERLGADMYPPFVNEDVPAGYDKGWDSIFAMDPVPHSNKPGYTSQGVLGFLDLYAKRNVPLHCEEPCRILDFKVKTAADDSLRGHTFDILAEGYQEQNKGFHFSDTLGARTFTYETHFSPIYFVYSGDINDDNKIDATDITDLQSYLAGKFELPWPEQRADINNDGKIDNTDLTDLRKLAQK